MTTESGRDVTPAPQAVGRNGQHKGGAKDSEEAVA